MMLGKDSVHRMLGKDFASMVIYKMFEGHNSGKKADSKTILKKP
jgi:hypothetical protein